MLERGSSVEPRPDLVRLGAAWAATAESGEVFSAGVDGYGYHLVCARPTWWERVMDLGLAVVAGVCVGLVLASLGGGSALLAVPTLVCLLDVPPSAAVTVSLLVVTPAACVGLLGSWRAGFVDVRTGAVLAAFGGIGAYPGARVGQLIDSELLMVGFGVLMVGIGMMVLRQGTVRALARGEGPAQERLSHRSLNCRLTVPTVAVLVGLLTGVFGVGGGVIMAPALMLLAGMNLRKAVGTSLLVVTTNGLIALLVRHGDLMSSEWTLVGAFGLGALGGVVIGVVAAGRVSEHLLTMTFAVVVTVLGAGTAAGSLLPLMQRIA